MRTQQLRGTTDWAKHTIRQAMHPRARTLVIGVLVVGNGTIWADNLELLVDDKPIEEAPRREIKATILETDQEFAGGSNVDLSSLTQVQIENVAVLGMVWGFLKYHHPRITAGELHWDFELLRVLPAVLDAGDHVTRNRLLAEWVESLGLPESCDPCAEGSREAHLLPNIAWIEDKGLLGAELSRQLHAIHRFRHADDGQFYVSHVSNVGNPLFANELGYPDQQPPDAGFRILALLRLWNIVEYLFPYRDLLEDNWHDVLRKFLPRIVAADDWDNYRLELLAFITHIQDGHANLWSELDVRPPRGDCHWPVTIRFVDDRAVVATFSDEAKGSASGFMIGDAIETIDGEAVDALIEEWAPYYSASNPTARLRYIARYMPRGECGESVVEIERQGKLETFRIERLPDIGLKSEAHDRPGDTFQLLTPEVAYIKLSSIRAQDISDYLGRAADTRGLVIDIRGYPSESVVFALGQHLVQAPTPFARFTVVDLSNPGAFIWRSPISLQPSSPAYQGKPVILINEAAISHSEYTAMALRAAPNAAVVGSTTQGADGNVSSVSLPGGLRATISGIGVFYPDKTPTQRVGIVPDIHVMPTIEGIREGRDEVLEEALRYILGSDGDEELIRRVAARP